MGDGTPIQRQVCILLLFFLQLSCQIWRSNRISQVVKVDSYGRLLHEIDVLDSDLEVFDVDLVWIRFSILL